MRRSRSAVAVAAVLALAGCAGSVAPSGDAVPSSPAAPTASSTASPSTAGTPTPSGTPAPPPVTPSACALPVSRWSAFRLAGAVLMAPAHLENLSAMAPSVASGIGGIVLFGTPPQDLRAQLLRLHAAAGAWPLLVASDEEGGGIQRLAALTGALPWPREMSARGPAAIRAAAKAMGRALRALTVRIDLAPVADLDAGPGPDATHPDGKRSFSADPATATADVLAFARGLLDAGIVPVVKHYPGLGTAAANTDDGPAVTAPLASLEGRDLLPFVAAVRAGLPAVMSSNAIVPGLSSLPVSLSSAAASLLRRHYGFRGVIVTDSLSARAVAAAGFGVGPASVQAIAAGADAVVIGGGETKNPSALATTVRAAIVDAVDAGRLPVTRLREAVRRLAALMGTPTC